VLDWKRVDGRRAARSTHIGGSLILFSLPGANPSVVAAMLLLSTTIVGYVRTTDSASAMVQLLFHHLGGIGDLARTAVRCHHPCAGAWTEACIQEQGLPHACDHYLSTVLIISAVLTIPNQTMLSAVICICGMGVFGLVYSGSLTVREASPTRNALTATAMQWCRSWHTSC
jgi:hypothetical protein